MDAKDLRVDPVLGERNDRNSFVHVGAPGQCIDRNKPFHDVPSSTMSKVDVQAVRPCAVIGPDRIMPHNTANSDTYPKKSQVEGWTYTDNGYRKPPDYPHKSIDYQHPSRNISPRQTFQENMQRMIVPPRLNVSKLSENSSNAISDRSVMLNKNTKLNVSTELKYCDVPYNVNTMTNEQRNSRNPELAVPNVNPSLMRNTTTHGWPPPGSMLQRPIRPYAPSDLYRYPEYPNRTRPITVGRPHHPIHDETIHSYSDPYCRNGNVRFEPYPTTKDRYPTARYEYIGNYTNPYQHTNFSPQKYNLQKTFMPNPYIGYPQVPLKYLESRVQEPHLDGYQRPPNQPPGFNITYHGQSVVPNFTQNAGNCLPNKLYSYPENTNKSTLTNKIPYDTNNKIAIDYDTNQVKAFPVPDNFYVNEIARNHLKGPVIMPNYPSVSMHTLPPHPSSHYRKDNFALKNYEYNLQFKNMEPGANINNIYSRIPVHYSPSVISPTDSNTSNDTIQTMGVSQEDCGYVSQSSTASGRSVDVARYHNYEPYKRYDYRYGPLSRSSSKQELTQNKGSGSTDKKNIDVRQFLQMWNEVDDEYTENNNNKEAVLTLSASNELPKHKIRHNDMPNNQEELYVLGLVNVPNEELGKYEHIQKVSKLPENIKGYNSLELLNQFEEVIESSNLQSSQSLAMKDKQEATRVPIKNIVSKNMSARPLSPLDVESKISQSVIHKEVGCNFEIKPCSPKMLNAEIAAPVQSLLGERAIEKITNPIVVQTSTLLNHRDNKGNFPPIKHQDHENMGNDIPSCKMIKTQFSTESDNNNLKTNYTIQDFESNSGVCLASLPRLDTDIELNFPEVNQQFIDANKGETVINSNMSSSATIDNGKSDTRTDFSSKETKDIVASFKNDHNESSPSPILDPDNNYSKLSKFRKTRPSASTKELFEKNLNNSAQSQRTNSVIIKNPDTIEKNTFSLNDSTLKIEPFIESDKTSHEPNVNFNNSEQMSSTPINLTYQHKIITTRDDLESSDNHLKNKFNNDSNSSLVINNSDNSTISINAINLCLNTNTSNVTDLNALSCIKQSECSNNTVINYINTENIVCTTSPESQETSILSTNDYTVSSKLEDQYTKEASDLNGAEVDIVINSDMTEEAKVVNIDDIDKTSSNHKRCFEDSTVVEGNSEFLKHDFQNVAHDLTIERSQELDLTTENVNDGKPTEEPSEIVITKPFLNKEKKFKTELHVDKSVDTDSNLLAEKYHETNLSHSDINNIEENNELDLLKYEMENASHTNQLQFQKENNDFILKSEVSDVKSPQKQLLSDNYDTISNTVLDIQVITDIKNNYVNNICIDLMGQDNKETDIENSDYQENAKTLGISFLNDNNVLNIFDKEFIENKKSCNDTYGANLNHMVNSLFKENNEINVENSDYSEIETKNPWIFLEETSLKNDYETNSDQECIKSEIVSKQHNSNKCYDCIDVFDSDKPNITECNDLKTTSPIQINNCDDAFDSGKPNITECDDLKTTLPIQINNNSDEECIKSEITSKKHNSDKYYDCIDVFDSDKPNITECDDLKTTSPMQINNCVEDNVELSKFDYKETFEHLDHEIQSIDKNKILFDNNNITTTTTPITLSQNNHIMTEAELSVNNELEFTQCNQISENFCTTYNNNTKFSINSEILNKEKSTHDTLIQYITDNKTNLNNLGKLCLFRPHSFTEIYDWLTCASDGRIITATKSRKYSLKKELFSPRLQKLLLNEIEHCCTKNRYFSDRKKDSIAKSIQEVILNEVNNKWRPIEESKAVEPVDSDKIHSLIKIDYKITERETKNHTEAKVIIDDVSDKADTNTLVVSCDIKDIPKTDNSTNINSDNSEIIVNKMKIDVQTSNITQTCDIAEIGVNCFAIAKDNGIDLNELERQQILSCGEKKEKSSELSFNSLGFNKLHRRSLKRSLSESCLYIRDHNCMNLHINEYKPNNVNDVEDGHTKVDGSISWCAKRKKLKVYDNNIDSPQVIENCNIVQYSRRNSTSSIYNDEVSFCIYIDNSCIIAEEHCIFDDNTNPSHLHEISEKSNDSKLFESVNDFHDSDIPVIAIEDNTDTADNIIFESVEENDITNNIWVDDVACVETVVSEDVNEDSSDSSASEAPLATDDLVEDRNHNQNEPFSVNIHSSKIKHIYGNTMCSGDIKLMETLYRTPQMNVNEKLNEKESHNIDFMQNFKEYDNQSLEMILSGVQNEEEASCATSISLTTTTSNMSNFNNFSLPCEGFRLSRSNSSEDVTSVHALSPLGNSDFDMKSDAVIHPEYRSLGQLEFQNGTQDDTVHSCESSKDEFISDLQTDVKKRSSNSSSPEVTSTTTEDKKSGILLKITNYKGSRVSVVEDSSKQEEPCEKIRCKFTELNHYVTSKNSKGRPLITKAAKKYIPPLKDYHDLKIRLPLPQQSLLKLKELKTAKEQPKINRDLNVKVCRNELTKLTIKKIKPNFEDVLKSIDEVQYKLHKVKNKKPKKNIPKVVIKKTENGSHYASTSNNDYNPDLTGRKWQPWVFLEKSHFIDKMALKNKPKAMFCHKRNMYVSLEKIQKKSLNLKNVENANIIEQPELDDDPSKVALKYTIRFKHSY